ncbi:MFS transporter [Arthrobacter halodurans]|uniref:MFS transporter n=1 Tax=Arthrobacter halodurans TaxID=516699 RepID=A0ABV4UK90_9MICC
MEPTAAAAPPATGRVGRPRPLVVGALGIGQILAWGSTFYLLTVLSAPITADTGWPTTLVVGGVSAALLCAAAVSPAVGTLISRGRGRAVLIASAAVLAAGLAALSAATTPGLYLAAWTVLGIGMGAGLYSPAFSFLGQLYGGSARSAITALTLYGGFASTLCWPLSAWLVEHIGWRGTCLAYAAAHVAVALPLYAAALPRHAPPQAPTPKTPWASAGSGPGPGMPTVVLVAAVATISTTVSTAMSVHMLTLFQAFGLTATAAVLLAAAIGPSQVAARVVELLAGGRHHPLWTLFAAVSAIAVATTAMGATATVSLVLVVCYGAGIGLASIGNGTAPLAVFGREHYARVMGRIAVPALLAQAAAPLWGSVLIDHLGERRMLLVLGGMAGAAILMVLTLLHTERARRRYRSGPSTTRRRDVP